jgi:hypothetical protein
MQVKRSLVVTVFVMAQFAACSDTDTPLNPGADYEGRHLELRTEYYYMYDGEPKTLETRGDYLAIKFHENISSLRIQIFMNKWKLEPIIREGDNYYKMYVVLTEDAFTLATKLAKHAPELKYVGPVFLYAYCYNHYTKDIEPVFTIPGNEILIIGDTEHVEVKQMLENDDAYFIDVTYIDITHSVARYAIPWGDPGDVFDLANELHRHSAVEIAEPNFLSGSCLASENRELTTAWDTLSN